MGPSAERLHRVLSGALEYLTKELAMAAVHSKQNAPKMCVLHCAVIEPLT